MSIPYRNYRVPEIPMEPLPNTVYYIKTVAGRNMIMVTDGYGLPNIFSDSDVFNNNIVKEYTHTQTSPLSTWNVPHNLGFYPDVSVTSVGGVTVLLPEIEHLSTMTLVIRFDIPFSGQARCS